MALLIGAVAGVITGRLKTFVRWTCGAFLLIFAIVAAYTGVMLYAFTSLR